MNRKPISLLLCLLGVIALLIPSFCQMIRDDTELARAVYSLGNQDGQDLIIQVDTGGKRLVALTFDDGPDPHYTIEVLDILKQYGVSATFFVVGEQAESYPELIQRELLEGHQIENHTYTHPDLRSRDAFTTDEEIGLTGEVIKYLTHRQPMYFRPPKKLFRRETLEIAEEQGYKTILWTICLEHQRSKTAEDMAKRLIDLAKPGSIILAHDGLLDRSKSVEALPLLISGYQKQGYKFVTLDELFRARR